MITVIMASPRKNGFSSGLLTDFLNKTNEPYKIYNAYELSAAPCIGCGYCKENGNCVNRDLDELFDSILASQRLVIATPIYNFTVPSPLKAIFDRAQVFYEHPVQGNRKLHLLVSCGRSGEVSIPFTEKIVKTVFDNLGFSEYSTEIQNYTDDTEAKLCP